MSNRQRLIMGQVTQKLSMALALILQDEGELVRLNEPLSIHSNWKIGGPADIFVEPTNEQQIAQTVLFAKDAGVPLVVIGDGTNLLFDDNGVRGIVLKIGRHLAKLNVQDGLIHAQAGVWVPRLARAAAVAGLAELEHVVGIPGTLGGLIWMNGGSMRKGIGENICSVSVVDETGSIRILTRGECKFSYRSSVFQSMKAIVVSATLRCKPGSAPQIKARMLQILRQRRKKFPRKLPNCGSVFVSGGELFDRFGPPGKVIEDLQLKGTRIGDAVVSPLHANFFVNVGRARAADMLSLIKQVREAVYAHTGVWMEAEVRYVTPQATIVPAHAVA